MKKIYKFPTGAGVPEGAIYLGTVTQTEIRGEISNAWVKCWLVWHYFLVEVKGESKNNFE